ncbi:MAG: flagellar hook basal-body protein [Pseudomonadota bacterium]|nr:flagellar hook basal-body protein [Pseudomonadota bacterium]
MSRDIYAAYAGAKAAWRHLEVVSANVANANTQGYREQRVNFEAEEGVVRAGTGMYSTEDGALVQDGVATHLALRGDAMFALADGTSTRDGGFRLDTGGRLVTSGGTPVLTDRGPVTLAPGEQLIVDVDGTVSGSESGELGRLRLVRLGKGGGDTGTRIGGNRWAGASTVVTDTDVSVVQGARESANVDPMRCMVELIEASRAFEAQQKVMQTSDEARARLNRMQE